MRGSSSAGGALVAAVCPACSDSIRVPVASLRGGQLTCPSCGKSSHLQDQDRSLAAPALSALAAQEARQPVFSESFQKPPRARAPPAAP